MAVRNITGTIQVRRDTAANWESVNPVLREGEFGYDTTNKIMRIGDGATAWKNLFTLIGKTIASCSWDEIAAISDSGTAPSIFRVGDKKTAVLSTGEKVTFVIMGFNHDDLASGGKAGITFGMENLFATKSRMNATSTNKGSWAASEMRNTKMPTIYSYLPSDLQAVIKEVTKNTVTLDGGDLTVSIQPTTDTLFLFSRKEIYDATAANYVSEGEQYEYWRINGKTNASRVKYLSDGKGNAESWWLRSSSATTTSYFLGVYSSGTLITTGSATSSYGVCMGFCV
ncbi:MAG: DUF6273 domain-containing protein [Clostridiales bacterium]|jgi:hypothetical protein|nr:DUF6273 domain-containing protein [Clostridiales bacterium]